MGGGRIERGPGLNARARDLGQPLHLSISQFLHLTGGVINNVTISGLTEEQM